VSDWGAPPGRCQAGAGRGTLPHGVQAPPAGPATLRRRPTTLRLRHLIAPPGLHRLAAQDAQGALKVAMLSEWLGTTAKEAEREAKEQYELVSRAKHKLPTAFGWAPGPGAGALCGLGTELAAARGMPAGPSTSFGLRQVSGHSRSAAR
jgi:hypothetical protein